MNSLPKIVTRQRRSCDLNPGPSSPESSTLTTRLPSHPLTGTAQFTFSGVGGGLGGRDHDLEAASGEEVTRQSDVVQLGGTTNHALCLIDPVVCVQPDHRLRQDPANHVHASVLLDSGAVGPAFKSQPQRRRVTVLGKLFTPIAPLFTKQRNW